MDAELFYVLDLGDLLAEVFSHFLQPMPANAMGHIVSFAINGVLWCVLAMGIAASVAAVV